VIQPQGWLPPDPSEVERRARLLSTALARIGITAFSPGERDLTIGPALLQRLLRKAKIPTVAANLFDKRGRRLFDADRMVDVAGVKVGIFGVIRPLPDSEAAWQAWELTARDPVATARDEVASLRGRGAQLIVALVHVGQAADTRKLLQEVPGIDWAVAGHSELNLETPEEIGGARLLEAMSMGKQFGRLDLHVVDGTGRFVDRGQRTQLLTILADHKRQIADLRKRAAETEAGKPGDKPSPMAAYYEQRIKELEKSIATETALAAAIPAEVKGSWFENRIVPLDTSIPDHAGMAPLVAAYNQENSRRAVAGKPVGLAARDPHMVTPVPAPGPGAPAVVEKDTEPLRYAGTVACGSCHPAALAFWRTTKHARALDTLKKTKRERDPTCVGCHVTGYLLPGGTRDIALATARLRDVGCESCHGPGVAHLTADDKQASTSRKVAAAVCLGCHTPDQTNGEFDYPLFLKAVLGPGHGQPSSK